MTRCYVDIDEKYEEVRAHIDAPGPYSHNIISYTLREVAAELGKDVANKMVDDLDLTDLFGIGKAE